MLLGGASVAAFTAASPEVNASEALPYIVRNGANGQDGVAPPWYWPWGASKAPTSGVSAENLIYGNTALRGDFRVDRRSAVLLGSVGGNGGDGKSVEQERGPPYRQPGGRGGDGGRVSYTLDTPSGSAVTRIQGYRPVSDNPWSNILQFFPIANFQLYSVGGAGGYGMTTPGQGGEGGKVELRLGDGAPVGAATQLVFTTEGSNFAGAWVVSQGGKGGAGGSTSRWNNGGAGGSVDVKIGGSVSMSTAGTSSAVVALQSLGGAGGSHDDQGLWHPPSGGGNGGAAFLTMSGKLASTGANSAGAIVQSVGGAGGTNSAIVGGAGGSRGGNGGAAQALLYGTITTTGANAPGVIVQSVGGVGGFGGGGIFSGGSGGNAGDGGTAKVETTGAISTAGKSSFGVVAQSIGGGKAGNAFQSGLVSAGGGGDGGSPLSPFFSSGGQGGTGGVGGSVSVTNRGTITTTGDDASGILAQSIGGGGGAGGDARAFGIGGAVALGGDGGNGASGGAVEVSNIARDLNNSGGWISTSGAHAAGIVAQSVGGGGGNGGDATAVSIGPHISYARAIGGSGGKGATGGSVTVLNGLNVVTGGLQAPGVLAMSIGGGGGNGGSATAKATAVAIDPRIPGLTITSGVGGQGGDGNAGGAVKVTNTAAVVTSGYGSAGVMAMSVGGGGGAGGGVIPLPTFSVAGLTSWLAGLRSGSVDFSFNNATGGRGGSGGKGGLVEINNSGSIITYGQGASGVVAMSVGGGGGAGGGAVLNAAANLTVNDSVGGNGGSGNHGGQVKVTNAAGASIVTTGAGSYAIHALSVGGGGGIGGAAMATSGGNEVYDAYGASQTKAQLVNVAKAALPQLKEWAAQYKNSNIAGKAGDALIGFLAKNFGTTAEKFASNKGIYSRLKPSVPLSLAWETAVGGKGGASGDSGGTADAPTGVWANGTLTTSGAAATAIVAQSVGGGGGKGGAAAAGAGKMWSSKTAVGGDGGGGGAGGVVRVELGETAKVSTYGNAAFGALAQSIGGGGGVTTTGRDLQAGELVLASAKALGGSNGAAGNGGNVSVSHAGSIVTTGGQAHGIVAQSVGGGGGVIADASFDQQGLLEISRALGEQTTIDMFDAAGIDIRADLAKAKTMSARSLRGVEQVRLGADGASGTGGEVSLAIGGSISTSGVGSFGVIAQSVGGGGGLVADGATALPVNGAVLLGGAHGAKGDGGDVKLRFDNAARITTSGDHAVGVLAQSIGGGGGFGGGGLLTGAAQGLASGRGGSIGNGGAVLISNAGSGLSIETSGRGAHGVIAQSLGGGGGYLGRGIQDDPAVRGFYDAMVYTGRPTNWAEQYDDPPEAQRMASFLWREMEADLKKANVKKTEDELLRQNQNELNAMAAARLNSRGTGERIAIELSGATIRTTGANAIGIFAQSGFQDVTGMLDPSRPGGNISINFAGKIEGGSGEGAAIAVDGGRVNAITINAGSTVSAASGKAILASFGSDHVANHGKLIGDVNLSVRGVRKDEVNSFDNHGTYQTAGSGLINLSNPAATGRSVFTNYGVLDVGGVGRIATAEVRNGKTDLRGTLLVDVNGVAAGGTQANDILKTTDLRVRSVAVKPHAIEGLLPSNSFRVVEANSVTVDSDWPVGPRNAVSGASEASPISWNVATNANGITISPGAADFAGKAPGNVTATEQALLGSLQSAWETGARGMAGAFADMANVASANDYDRMINSMTLSEGLGQPAAGQTLASSKAHGYAMSCPAFAGGGVMIREGSCVWGQVIGSRTVATAGRDTDGFSQTGTSYRLGGQWELSPGWFVGATGGYNTSQVSTKDRNSRIEGDSGDIAIALKRQLGPWLFAGAVSFGYGSYDSASLFQMGDSSWQALNTSNVWTAGLRLRGAYEFAFTNWYVRPFADLDLVQTIMPGYRLSGDGAVLSAQGLRSWTTAFKPGVEFGARINLDDASWLRPYASVGMTLNGGGGLRQRVSFSEGGAPGITFTSSSEIPDRLLDLAAGVQFLAHGVYELRGEYKAQLGKDFVNQEFSLRAAMRF